MAALGGITLVVEAAERSGSLIVALASDGPAQLAATALTRLELLGYLASDHTGRYSRTGKAPPTRGFSLPEAPR